MTRVLRISLLALLLASPAAAQEQHTRVGDPPVVITTGEGIVTVVPDRAWVTITAESRASNPREAQRQNSQAMNAVVARIKGAGIADEAIRTRSYDLQPEFDYRDGKQTLRGYLARNSVEVRLDDINRVGEVIDMAVGSGATSVSGVRFDLKKRDEAEREALRLAVADARARADAAASGAGMTVASVLRIDETREMAPPPRPVAMRMGAETMVADMPPPISPGEQQIRVVVTLTAAIR